MSKDWRTKHGLSRTPEYRAWQTMRLRCLEPANPAYRNYGGRGITVCERWRDSPTNFLTDLGPKPSPNHELDRIDNDGPYAPWNCRWVLRSENDRNRRNNVWIEFRGERRTMAEWCERYGLRDDTLRSRLKNGWTVERAITTPARSKAPNGSILRRPSRILAGHNHRKGATCPACDKGAPEDKVCGLLTPEAKP